MRVLTVYKIPRDRLWELFEQVIATTFYRDLTDEEALDIAQWWLKSEEDEKTLRESLDG